MITFANYFTPISTKEANARLQTADSFILLIGRLTCPYCRRFEPKLTQVAKDDQLTIHFLNSENQDSDTQELCTTYDVSAVPGFSVVKSGHVKVVCDSSLSEEAILDFIMH